MLQNNKIRFTYAFHQCYNEVTSCPWRVSATVKHLFS